MSRQVFYNLQGFDTIQKEVTYYYQDNYKQSWLSSGIQIRLFDRILYQNYAEKSEHTEYPFLISHFILSGNQGVISPNIEDIKPEYIEKSNHNYLLFLPNIEEIEQYQKGENYQSIIIKIPLYFLRQFIFDFEQLPKLLKGLIETDNSRRFHRTVGNLTPMMQTIVKQIWEHPYQGAIARIYLEAKVLELISLQLFQLLKQESNQPRHLKLTSQEIERVHEAKTILQNNYLTPPSLVELAQKTHLDRMKLQQGFRQVFQVTPFEYLQNYRLDLARILLEEKDLTVTNIAHRIGYSNVSYFSRAFKRRFGVTPGKYRC